MKYDALLDLSHTTVTFPRPSHSKPTDMASPPNQQQTEHAVRWSEARSRIISTWLGSVLPPEQNNTSTNTGTTSGTTTRQNTSGGGAVNPRRLTKGRNIESRLSAVSDSEWVEQLIGSSTKLPPVTLSKSPASLTIVKSQGSLNSVKSQASPLG